MVARIRRHLWNVSDNRGSALVLAVFALTLLGGMGVALLFVTQQDTRASGSSLTLKRAFYGAEAALEQGRAELRSWQIASASLLLDEELEQAAGGNNAIDFDPNLVVPIYDSSGNVTGFTGTGDDVPLVPLSAFEDGLYAAYLTNDPADGRSNMADSNTHLAITGLYVGPDSSFEKVEAVVHHYDPVPPFAATILIAGEDPLFQGGTSSAKLLTGNNCRQPAPPGPAVPVVGTFGPAAESMAELGVDKPATYIEGLQNGVDTVDDVTGTVDPRWNDCAYLHELALRTREMADVIGDENTPLSELGTPGDPKVVFIDGDYDVNGTFHGAGVLWVTGEFYFQGTASWDGVVFAVGEGYFERYGSGNGDIEGGAFVANISGPDQILFTSDDCAGDDGILGSGDDGVAGNGTWDVSGGGTGDTVYCDSYVEDWRIRWPFRITEFRQR